MTSQTRRATIEIMMVEPDERAELRDIFGDYDEEGLRRGDDLLMLC